MRQLLAAFAYRRSFRLTGMAEATSDPTLRSERRHKAALWALREKFLSRLKTWPEHRKAVRALRERHQRGIQPRKFTIVGFSA